MKILLKFNLINILGVIFGVILGVIRGFRLFLGVVSSFGRICGGGGGGSREKFYFWLFGGFP